MGYLKSESGEGVQANPFWIRHWFDTRHCNTNAILSEEEKDEIMHVFDEMKVIIRKNSTNDHVHDTLSFYPNSLLKRALFLI